MRPTSPQAAAVPSGPRAGLMCLVALLVALTLTVGLDAAGWAAGLGCGAVVLVGLVRGMSRHRRSALGPADRVTLARAVLTGGVAALCATSYSRPVSVTALVLLSAVALALDAVDGRVARRTGTVSALGARFDMEVDALLILVLSLYVAPSAGWWVLAIGGARYVLVAARWSTPRLRGSAPARYWCKVVAAAQGVVLTLVAADVLPDVVSQTALVVALALLVESFGREAYQVWRSAPQRPASRPVQARRPGVMADG